MSEPVTAEQTPRDGWRHLLVMLIICAVGFLGQPDPAAAQVQTYSYQGPAFDLGACTPYYPPGVCISGSVTASVTIVGNGCASAAVPPGSIASIYLNAGAAGKFRSRKLFCRFHSGLRIWANSGLEYSWLRGYGRRYPVY